MLRINRLRVEINTANGMYGIDESFKKGLNFVASKENTCGKSSILAAIYYCLGFEQILGGVAGIGGKVLTSAFKNTIDDNGKSWNVTESGAYHQIIFTKIYSNKTIVFIFCFHASIKCYRIWSLS